MFFYLSRLLFSGFLQFKGNFVLGQNNLNTVFKVFCFFLLLHTAGVYPLRHPVVHDLTPAAPSSPMMLPSSIGSAMDIGIKVVGARNQFGLVPKKDSLVNGKENLIADAGLMMGRSFRVGWGPGFVLVHSGTPLGKRETKPAPTTQPSLAGDFLTPKLRPGSSEGSPSFGVTLEKINVASHANDGISETVLVRSLQSLFSLCS